MSRSHHIRRASLPALKLSAFAVGVMLAGAAQAEQFKFDNGVSGSFDTTVSLGVSIRAEEANKNLIGIANGGIARSVNDDDGNRAYKKNRPFSELLKVTHDLEVKYEDWGFFARGLYFVDFKNRKNNALGPIGRDRTATDGRILDAFVTKGFDVMDKNLRLRVGQQVISWGESTFIPNGINVINSVDVSKLRVPGSELKEAFIPTASVLASMELTKGASIEAWMQFNHDKTKLDPRGSYWSNNDFASDDGNKIFVTFGRRKDDTGPFTNPIPPTTPVAGPAAAGLYGPFDPAAAVWAPRIADRDPTDSGQYGVALRYLATSLNNTEFGLYYMNYHSRTPFFSGIKGTVTSILTGGPLAVPVGHTGTAAAFAEYPENIRLIGFSFNTQGPLGIALQGELSHRPNQPLQLGTTELVLAALGAPNTITGFNQIVGAPVGATASALVPNGTYLRGYTRHKVSQFQMTGTKSFPNVLGAEQGVLVGEYGYNRVNGLDPNQRYAGPGTSLPATGLAASLASVGAFAQQTDGYATSSSYGYRLAGRLEYSNLMFGANVSPRIAFSHDVKGVSSTFVEGVKSLAIGAGFDWQKKLTLDLNYSRFYGGKVFCGTDSVVSPQVALAGQPQSWCNNTNSIADRDFFSVVASYSF